VTLSSWWQRSSWNDTQVVKETSRWVHVRLQKRAFKGYLSQPIAHCKVQDEAVWTGCKAWRYYEDTYATAMRSVATITVATCYCNRAHVWRCCRWESTIFPATLPSCVSPHFLPRQLAATPRPSSRQRVPASPIATAAWRPVTNQRSARLTEAGSWSLKDASVRQDTSLRPTTSHAQVFSSTDVLPIIRPVNKYKTKPKLDEN